MQLLLREKTLEYCVSTLMASTLVMTCVICSPLPCDHGAGKVTWSPAGSWSSPCLAPHPSQTPLAMCALKMGRTIHFNKQTITPTKINTWSVLLKSTNYYDCSLLSEAILTFEEEDWEHNPHAKAGRYRETARERERKERKKRGERRCINLSTEE